MEPVIYWCKSAGLANRIRSLIGYQILSYYLETSFYLCWEPDHACDAEFSELFQSDNINLITTAQKQAIENEHNTNAFTSNLTHIGIWEIYAREVVSREHFHNTYIHYLNNLHPLPKIADKVSSFFEKNDLHNASAIHIRFTDNRKGYKRWTKRQLDGFDPENIPQLIGFEKYIRDVIRSNPNSTFFLATDNRRIQNYIQKTFPGQIIIYPKKYRNRYRFDFSFKKFQLSPRFQRTSSIVDALIELLLLSRCRTLLGTYWSSFSHIAALMGNTKYFEVRGNKYVPVPKENIYIPNRYIVKGN